MTRSGFSLELQEGRARWLYAALFVMFFAILAREALYAGGTRLSPALILVILLGPLGTLLVGTAFGNLAFVIALGALVTFYMRHPTQLPAEIALRANLFAMTCTSQLFVFGYALTFRRMRKQIADARQAIEQRLHERAELTRAVSADLIQAVARLREALAEPRPELHALVPAQQHLEQVMDGARQKLHFRKEADLISWNVLADFRRRMTRWLISVSTVLVLLLLVRLLFIGHGALGATVVALCLHFVALAGSELLPARRALFVALFTASAFISILIGVGYWGLHEPPPNLIFLATLSYNAFLISSRRSVMFSIVGACLAAQLIVALLTEGGGSAWGTATMLSIAIVTILLQVCWFVLDERTLKIFQTAQERADELKHLDAFRARICGTLFHDVANFVQVLGMIVQLADRRKALTDEDLDTMRRFHARLGSLVKAALEVLEHGDRVSRERVVSVLVEPMFRELRELFQFRLSSKAQTLRTESAEQLGVLSVPELLRDSILANLVSNAIKFSPQGGTIELSAQRSGNDAQIVVRDQGPGFPSDLMPRLSASERVVSTEGTAGEQGLGLGLTLAAEHLRRMGGGLSLRNHEAGGGEATVRVPLA